MSNGTKAEVRVDVTQTTRVKVDCGEGREAPPKFLERAAAIGTLTAHGLLNVAEANMVARRLESQIRDHLEGR
jgi:hypothetical protein